MGIKPIEEVKIVSEDKHKIDFEEAERLANQYIFEAHPKEPLKKIFIHIIAMYEWELRLMKAELDAKTD